MTKSSTARFCLYCTLLFVIVCAIYAQSTGFATINYDDHLYVPADGRLSRGFDQENLAWIFSADRARPVWAPVALGSYIIEAGLFGESAAVFHRTNFIVHGLNAVLLLGLLFRTTGNLPASAIAAALFAVHPLRVESVAWVTERKDVLAMFFGMLSLHAYVTYCRSRAFRWYGASVAAILLSLGCKPMFATIPVLLLILDYWPLGRTDNRPASAATGLRAAKQAGSTLRETTSVTWRGLLLEKIPFAIVSTAISIATLLSHHGDRNLVPQSFIERVSNAVVSYNLYLLNTIWPSKLAVFYPIHLNGHSLWLVAAAFLSLLLISALVVSQRRAHPYLLAGWCWFLIALLPMIGIVRTGDFSRADRFTYLAHIGLLAAITWWAVLEIGSRWPRAVNVGAITAVLILTVLAHVQVGHWRDSVTLMRHTLAVTDGNASAHSMLGSAYSLLALTESTTNSGSAERWSLPSQLDTGPDIAALYTKAELQFEAAIEIEPSSAKHRNNLGTVLLLTQRFDAAAQQLRRAIELEPDNFAARNSLGLVLQHQGRHEGSLREFEKANQLSPGDPSVCQNLASAHMRVGGNRSEARQWRDALNHFQAACELTPGNPYAFYNAGRMKLQIGDRQEAIRDFRQALRIDPHLVVARQAIARALGQAGPAQHLRR